MFGSRIIKLFIVSLFFLFCGFSYADQTGVPAKTKDLGQFKTNHIYIILSRQGQISKLNGGYLLVMKQVHPDILAFTPPPIRDSELVGVQDFVNIWDSKLSLLDKSPPFGAVVFKSFKSIKNTDFQSYVLPLYTPIYNPSKDTLTFTIKTTANFDNLLGYHESIALYIE